VFFGITLRRLQAIPQELSRGDGIDMARANSAVFRYVNLARPMSPHLVISLRCCPSSATFRLRLLPSPCVRRALSVFSKRC